MFRKQSVRIAQKKRSPRKLKIEPLEDRSVLSAFSVLNLNDSGAGSLRQAMLDANSTVGADTIDFDVAGIIRLTSGALPTLSDNVSIDGTTAPGFAGTPVVEVDYNNFGGMQFNANAAGSALQSLSLVHSSNFGVKLNGGGHILIVGNFIGLQVDGSTVLANKTYGIDLENSTTNTIGGALAVERNVISGNRKDGVYINGGSSNEVIGNYIGTNSAGTLARGNAGSGIVITGSSSGNTVGGDHGNVISGNSAHGLYVKGKAAQNIIAGNTIGLNAAGNAALGNGQDGVKIEKATGNLIGNSDPVSSIDYFNANLVPTQPVSGWQGIRAGDLPDHYLISGTSDDFGLLFDGTLAGVGQAYTLLYPNSIASSIYGPDNLGGGNIRFVGTYRNADYATAPVEVNGFVFEGTVNDFADATKYTTIDYPGAKFNYVHSTMGGLAVGNYDSPVDHGKFDLPLGPGHAYIYDIATATFLTDVVFPGALSNTAYGIWYNGGTSYTICGGYSLDPVENFGDQNAPLGTAYLVDYDAATGTFSHWTKFSDPRGTNFITHFEGISSVEKGVYTLNADSVQTGTGHPAQGSWVSVRRNTDGSFGTASWVDLNYIGVDPTTNVTSSNSVYGNHVVGIVIGANPFSYQATVNSSFQLSNVISGNLANGIELSGASSNRISMNYIGTDSAGAIDFGNGSNGILITSSSSNNLIGGEATGGNDPTNGAFVVPPQGNLISGNDANGVLINGKSTFNQLSGNFIGTDSTGNVGIGNSLDGVKIEKANNNSLLGCTFQQDPFVFYNVISGNGGNGLRVNNANNTTIQANFFGMGADNATALGNALNGVLIEGSSSHTIMGGPIPLGNVDACNGQNGIVVQDKASFFTSYNTFCGLAAFSDDPNFGNAEDGMLITSTGGNILIRTNVITENGDDGIEISGKARGVRVAGNIIGLNTEGFVPMGNTDNGIEVGGNARDIVIGGPQPTFNIIPRNIISRNGNNGVAIVGTAHNITVSHSYIGTDLAGGAARPNGNAGVAIGSGTYSNTVGAIDDPSLITVISGNTVNGIDISGSTKNTVVNCYIGVDSSGLNPLGNGGNGVYIVGSFKNAIGPSSAGGLPNVIANNGASGVFVQSGNRNGIFQNSIHDNALLGIDLFAGANNNQASPVLISKTIRSQEVQVYGTLTSTPKTTFTLDFFASDANDDSGRIYLGALSVKTDSTGFAAFTFFGPIPPVAASFITATASDPDNNTSEFSNAVS